MEPPARHGGALPSDALDDTLGALPAPLWNRNRDCHVAVVVIASEEQVASCGRGGLGHGREEPRLTTLRYRSPTDPGQEH